MLSYLSTCKFSYTEAFGYSDKILRYPTKQTSPKIKKEVIEVGLHLALWVNRIKFLG